MSQGGQTPFRIGSKRYGVWIQARQHAWETGGSWVSRGLIEWLVSDDPRAETLRNLERFSRVYQKIVSSYVEERDSDELVDAAIEAMLEQLEEGEEVEVKEKVYQEETIANYRMAVLVLSAVAAAFFVVILLLPKGPFQLLPLTPDGIVGEGIGRRGLPAGPL